MIADHKEEGNTFYRTKSKSFYCLLSCLVNKTKKTFYAEKILQFL